MNTSNFKWLGSNVLYRKNKQIFHITLDYDVFTLVSEEDPTCTVRVGRLLICSVHTYMYIAFICMSYPAMYTCALNVYMYMYTVFIYTCLLVSIHLHILVHILYRYIWCMHRRDSSTIITHRGIYLHNICYITF